MDALNLYFLTEDPDQFEEVIRREIELSRTDPQARRLIEIIYCDEDRDAAFQRYKGGLEFRYVQRLLGYFGVTSDTSICEVGGGPGFLAWALHQAGYRDVSLLEPNSNFITGTGYLCTRPDADGVKICNDLGAWYASPERVEVILTRNCLHHFKNISWTAACIRQKMMPGATWVAMRESYAETDRELYARLRDHTLCHKYGIYEYSYPANHYIEAIKLAGFCLLAVVPRRYGNGCLQGHVFDEGSFKNRLFTAPVDWMLKRLPATTVWLYEVEHFVKRYLGLAPRLFSRPQAMVFRRAELA